MKNRVRQRANRKMAYGIKKNKDMRNASGCIDLTAYNAIINIEKEQRMKKRNAVQA